VNMLSPPLLGVLAWNLAIYALIVVAAVVPGKWVPRLPLPPLQHWLAGVPANGRRTGRLRTDVFARFQQHWRTAAGAQQWLWWK